MNPKPKSKPKAKDRAGAHRPGAATRTSAGPSKRRSWFRLSLASIDRTLLIILVASALIRLWGIGDRLPDASLGVNVIDDTAIEETDRTNILRSWAMWRGGMKPFDLNPHTGGWPALSFYLTLAIQLVYKAWYGLIHAPLATTAFAEHVERDSAGLFLLSRIVNAMIGIASVAFTWRLGLLLVGRAGAILAALFLAANPLHVVTSQHISDPNLLALAFVALAAISMAKVAEGGGTRDSILAGAWIGLAAACKYVPLVLLAPLALAHVRGARWKAFALAGGVAFTAMFLASPYTFLDWKTTVIAFGVQQRSLFSDWVGQSAFPISLPTYLISSLPATLGWPVYLFSVVGFVSLWKRGPGPRTVALIALVIVLANGALRTAQERYLLVAYPVLVIAAAVGVLWLLERLAAFVPQGKLSGRATALLAAICVLAPMPRLLEIRAALRQPDSRHEARRWVNDHVGPSKLLALELYGPVFTPRERNLIIWPFFATQAQLVATAYHPEFLDGLETIVVSGEVSRRFEADSLKYPTEAAYYAWLRTHGESLWRSDGEHRQFSGPIIEVRSLPRQISTRAQRDSLFARLGERSSGTYRLGLWCHDLSILFARAGDYDRSEEWALRGLEIGATGLSPRLQSALALARLNLGDFAGAEEAARRGIAQLPSAFALHLYRGMALERLGRLEEALQEMRAGFERSGDPALYLNIGQVQASLGRYEEAVATLAQVPTGIPERAGARRDMAIILMKLGRNEEGLAALREAAALATNPGEARLLSDEVARLERGQAKASGR